jgi:ubiquinol-cytochrome c reductase iron-sulfur subunit
MEQNDPVSRSRRSFLTLATAGAGIVTVGAGVASLLGTLSPAADVVARTTGVDVTLADIPVGTQLLVRVLGVPVYIRHRTDAEIAEAEAVDLEDLPYPETLDVLGRYVGSADDKVRRVTPEGRYIALIGLDYSTGCRVLEDGAGDYGGWFEVCRGAHFDSSGRYRKGVARENLRIPAYELIDGTTLRLLDPRAVQRPTVDELLYR